MALTSRLLNTSFTRLHAPQSSGANPWKRSIDEVEEIEAPVST